MTNFKRNLIVTIAALFAMGIAMPAIAQPLTGTVNLSGTVAPTTHITVNATGNGANMDLGTDGVDIDIAEVIEYSNSGTGYTVTVRSAKAFAATADYAMLTNGVTVDELVYTLKYGTALGTAAAVVFTNGDAPLTNVGAKGNVTKHLWLSFTSIFLSAGTYTDTLTLTIAAQ